LEPVQKCCGDNLILVGTFDRAFALPGTMVLEPAATSRFSIFVAKLPP
jgi:hypothetical protein